MQETIQYQMNHLGDNLNNGDVVLCNHPSAGGSHLPDLTVITPVSCHWLSGHVISADYCGLMQCLCSCLYKHRCMVSMCVLC